MLNLFGKSSPGDADPVTVTFSDEFFHYSFATTTYTTISSAVFRAVHIAAANFSLIYSVLDLLTLWV